jgi:hypothetical protein
MKKTKLFNFKSNNEGSRKINSGDNIYERLLNKDMGNLGNITDQYDIFTEIYGIIMRETITSNNSSEKFNVLLKNDFSIKNGKRHNKKKNGFNHKIEEIEKWKDQISGSLEPKSYFALSKCLKKWTEYLCENTFELQTRLDCQVYKTLSRFEMLWIICGYGKYLIFWWRIIASSNLVSLEKYLIEMKKKVDSFQTNINVRIDYILKWTKQKLMDIYKGGSGFVVKIEVKTQKHIIEETLENNNELRYMDVIEMTVNTWNPKFKVLHLSGIVNKIEPIIEYKASELIRSMKIVGTHIKTQLEYSQQLEIYIEALELRYIMYLVMMHETSDFDTKPYMMSIPPVSMSQTTEEMLCYANDPFLMYGSTYFARCFTVFKGRSKFDLCKKLDIKTVIDDNSFMNKLKSSNKRNGEIRTLLQKVSQMKQNNVNVKLNDFKEEYNYGYLYCFLKFSFKELMEYESKKFGVGAVDILGIPIRQAMTSIGDEVLFKYEKNDYLQKSNVFKGHVVTEEDKEVDESLINDPEKILNVLKTQKEMEFYKMLSKKVYYDVLNMNKHFVFNHLFKTYTEIKLVSNYMCVTGLEWEKLFLFDSTDLALNENSTNKLMEIPIPVIIKRMNRFDVLYFGHSVNNINEYKSKRKVLYPTKDFSSAFCFWIILIMKFHGEDKHKNKNKNLNKKSEKKKKKKEISYVIDDLIIKPLKYFVELNQLKKERTTQLDMIIDSTNDDSYEEDDQNTLFFDNKNTSDTFNDYNNVFEAK